MNHRLQRKSLFEKNKLLIKVLLIKEPSVLSGVNLFYRRDK
jgi:hypothetical protein